MKTRFQDLTGQRFGRLTIIGFAGMTAKQARLWACRCDCGKESTVRYSNLSGGHTRSCGCGAVIHNGIASNKLPTGMAECNRLFSSYKKNARKRQKEFTLTKAQFHELTSADCYYCGASPAMKILRKNRSDPYIYNGIDRIDNAVGYIIDNVRPCCKRCNFLKSTMTEAEFYDLVMHCAKINCHLGLS